MRLTTCLAAGIAAATLAAPATADIIFPGPVDPLPAETLQLAAGQSGTVILGTSSETGTAFTIEGDGLETLLSQISGDASVSASDGAFSDLTIRATDPSFGFTEIAFDLDATADGTVTLNFFDGSDNIFTTMVGATGQNFVSARAINGQVIQFVGIESTDTEFSAISQIRIGGMIGPTGPLTPIPAPGALGLLGFGLIACAAMRRRRN